MDNKVIVIALGLFGIILLFNVVKIFMNIFSSSESSVAEVVVDPLVDEVRGEVSKEVKPHLHALEAMYKNGDNSGGFGSFVFGLFKDKFSTYVEKNEKLVEDEICKCCGEYEGAECKEEFCLEGIGIDCQKEK